MTPPRYRLRPGTSVLPRETGVVQVGLDAPRRALLPDVAAVRHLLDALGHGSAVDVGRLEPAGPAARTVDLLGRADLLVPAADLADLDPALLARHGAGARGRAEARSSSTVHVDAGPRLRPALGRLLADAGLATAVDGEHADVALVVADGRLDRGRLDPWVRDGVPHLAVEALDGGFVVGPFVVPGATACVRCVDAHRGEQDPLRPLLLERAALRPAAPHDPLAAGLALAWAVRDVVRVVEGERPATWSATVAVLTTPGSEPELAPHPWTRHPCCGCGWDVRVTAPPPG